MEALLFTIDRLDFEVGQHPFMRATEMWDSGALEEARREMGYFALAMGHALDVLERGGLEPDLLGLALQVRRAAGVFLPEDRPGALARAFRHGSADLRQAAVMVIQQVAAATSPVEAWAVLTALDILLGRMREAFRIEIEAGGAPAAVADPRGLQPDRLTAEAREHIEEAVRYLFEAGLRLQDHLLRTAKGQGPIAQGA